MDARTRALAPGMTTCSLVLLAGCATPQIASHLVNVLPGNGHVGLFEQASGAGSLNIRIIDKRPRQVQSFTDADTFGVVRFDLANSVKLKQTMSTAANASGSIYAAVFQAIPADTGSNYVLRVGLFRNLSPGAVSNLGDPGYGNVLNKVGEGASTSISVAPGENKTVTVTINAVGNFNVDSKTINVNHATPVFMSGDTGYVDSLLTLAKDPDTATVSVFLTDLSNNPVAGTRVERPRSDWMSPPNTATLSFQVPTATTTTAYRLVVEAATGSPGQYLVQSRRSRDISVEATASIGTINLY